MPGGRARATNGEAAPSSSKDKSTASTANTSTVLNAKSRKAGAAASAHSKDDAVHSASANGSVASLQTSTPLLPWALEDVSTLNDYRQAYRLETSSAFSTALNTAILTAPGIGMHSPTMARKKAKRKSNKEQLAMAVRKHFNNLAVSEPEVVVEFLYKVHARDEAFKLRFGPKTR